MILSTIRNERRITVERLSEVIHLNKIRTNATIESLVEAGLKEESIWKSIKRKVVFSWFQKNLDGIDDWYGDFLKSLKRLPEEKKVVVVWIRQNIGKFFKPSERHWIDFWIACTICFSISGNSTVGGFNFFSLGIPFVALRSLRSRFRYRSSRFLRSFPSFTHSV